jgi:hypothetical protein
VDLRLLRTEVVALIAVKEPDPDLGVTESPVFDRVIVDRHDYDDGSDEPRPEIAALGPGDTILFRGGEVRLSSVGQRCHNGRRELYRIGFPPEAVGTVATLYVDRDPYLLDVCNGPIEVVDPEEVTVP